MLHTRRKFITTIGATVTGAALPRLFFGAQQPSKKHSGWLIFNTHGLDEEGWGPIRATYLERLLERLLTIETVEVLPAGRALAKYVS